MNTWLYAGSFDPVTNGHLDIIERSAKLCDKLVVAILINGKKTPTFSFEERKDFLERSLVDISNVEVVSFDGLLADFVDRVGASVIIKGLRAVSDYEYELQMALLNKKLNPKLETVFMTANEIYSYLSSSAVKEVAEHGGDITGLVPEVIREDIEKRFK